MRSLRFVSVAVIWMGSMGTAHAQSAESAPLARAHWNDGARALAAGDIDAARTSFRAAYDLLPDPELAQSLGEVEYRSHLFADAVRHLTVALDSNKLTREERRSSKKSLDQALTHVGRLFVEANVERADIRVDNERIGETPLGQQPWYLDPGRHIVAIRKDQYVEATQTAEIEPDKTVRLLFTLSSQPIQPGEQMSAQIAAVTPAFPMPTVERPQENPAPEPPPPTASRPPAWLLVTGVTLTGISVGLGTYFSLRHNPDTDHAHQLSAQTIADVGKGGCALGVEKTPGGTAICEQLADAYKTIDTHRHLAVAGFAAGGVIGAATIATFFLWPRRVAATSVSVSFSRTPGVTITGEF